ncbi:MAG: hypothetical protein LBV74_04800 [Tannerella sp.]|jgi:Co/Zn/Cd efflux system component|nr:hypothetical protein [Tannerella sp.]
MKKKKTVKILLILIAFIIIAAAIAYFKYEPEKPWLAFYIACCGGVLVVNLIISVIFVSKNFKGKR